MRFQANVPDEALHSSVLMKVVQAQHDDDRSNANGENETPQNQSAPEEYPLETIQLPSGNGHRNRL